MSGQAFDIPELFEWLLQQQKPVLFGERRTSKWKLVQGETFEVALTLHVRNGETSDYTVEELYPSSWAVSDIQVSHGSFSNSPRGRIVWSGENLSQNATLIYTLTSAEDTDGPSAIAGTYSNGIDVTETLRSGLLLVPNELHPFTSQQSIGADEVPGLAGRYSDGWGVIGSGAGIRGSDDAFHYLYRTIAGDFRLSISNAQMESNWKDDSTTKQSWAKLGLMARQNLEGGSAHAFAMTQWEDHALLLQARETESTSMTRDTLRGINHALWEEHNGSIGLKRDGDMFTGFYVDAAGQDVDVDSVTIEMIDPIYVGVAATASQRSRTFLGLFSDVEFTHGGQQSPITSWMLHE